jgi:hypothetical protein
MSASGGKRTGCFGVNASGLQTLVQAEQRDGLEPLSDAPSDLASTRKQTLWTRHNGGLPQA